MKQNNPGGSRPFVFDIETGGLSGYRSSIYSLSLSQADSISSQYAAPVPGTFISQFARENVWNPIARRNHPLVTEQNILSSFIGTLEQNRGATLAGWNIGYKAEVQQTGHPPNVSGGRLVGFDIPFVMTRARKYGLEERARSAFQGVKIRDIGQEWALKIARGAEAHPELIDEKLHQQVIGYMKNASQFGGGSERIARKTAESGVKLAGWKLQSVHKAVFGEGFSGAHTSEADILATQRLAEALPNFQVTPEFLTRWNKEALKDTLINTLIKGTGQYQEALGRAEKFGITDYFKQSLEAEVLSRKGSMADVLAGRGISETLQKVGRGEFSRRAGALSIFKKHPRAILGAGALLGLYAVQPGSLFSGKDDEYNTIEGLPHGGVAERKRRELTDFGSGYQNHSEVQKAIRESDENVGWGILGGAWLTSQSAQLLSNSRGHTKIAMGHFRGYMDLWHGTPTANVGSISRQGLRPNPGDYQKVVEQMTAWDQRMVNDAKEFLDLQKNPGLREMAQQRYRAAVDNLAKKRANPVGSNAMERAFLAQLKEKGSRVFTSGEDWVSLTHAAQQFDKGLGPTVQNMATGGYASPKVRGGKGSGALFGLRVPMNKLSPQSGLELQYGAIFNKKGAIPKALSLLQQTIMPAASSSFDISIEGGAGLEYFTKQIDVSEGKILWDTVRKMGGGGAKPVRNIAGGIGRLGLAAIAPMALIAGGYMLAKNLGAFFSGKDDAYNTVEGLSHKGMAAKKRQKNTSFGSGWRGLSAEIAATAIGGTFKELAPNLPGWLQNREGDDQSAKEFSFFAQALDKYGAEAGTGHKRIIIPKKILTEEELVENLGFVPVKVAIPEAGQTQQESFRHPDMNYHIHHHGEVWTMHEDRHAASTMLVKKALSNPNSGFFEKIGNTVSEFVKGIPHVLEEGIPGAYYYVSGKLTGADTMIERLRREIPEDYNRLLAKAEKEGNRFFRRVKNTIPSKDDFYNTLEGLRHGGFAQRSRQDHSDFGSGWDAIRGLLRGKQTFDVMKKSRAFQRALTNAKQVKELGKGKYGTAFLMEGTYRGTPFEFVRKVGKIGEHEVAAMQAIQESVGPSVYRAHKGSIDMEFFKGQTFEQAYGTPAASTQGVEEALGYLHRKGYHHGDLHMGNVIVAQTPKGPKIGLIDLGQAKPLGMGGTPISADIAHLNYEVQMMQMDPFARMASQGSIQQQLNAYEQAASPLPQTVSMSELSEIQRHASKQIATNAMGPGRKHTGRAGKIVK